VLIHSFLLLVVSLAGMEVKRVSEVGRFFPNAGDSFFSLLFSFLPDLSLPSS